MDRPFARETLPYLGDLLSMVIGHLLNGMILQVYAPPKFNSKSPWKMMVGEDYLPLGMAKFVMFTPLPLDPKTMKMKVKNPQYMGYNHEKWISGATTTNSSQFDW